MAGFKRRFRIFRAVNLIVETLLMFRNADVVNNVKHNGAH